MANIGLGSALAIGPSTTDMTTIGAIRNLSGPNATADVAVSNTLDTVSFKGKKKGNVDAGDLTFTVEYSSTDASHNVLGTALADTTNTWSGQVFLRDSTASPEEFTGYITGLSREVVVDDIITADVTWTYDGDPGIPTT